jgi:MerR family transcriptional regulator/heat shock protein HspR
MERKKKGKAAYMISAVAESYDIHPQTLRLYEREGLLKPSRSEGNTRLYTQEDLERLEVILNLTRDLGVNLAGVEVILNMRQRLEEMQCEMQEFIEYVERELANRSPELNQKIHNALVKVTPPHVTLVRTRKTERNENL